MSDENLSATMKVARDAEREMVETFARILAETDPRELDSHLRHLDHLAHERRLAIQFEAARVMRDIGRATVSGIGPDGTVGTVAVLRTPPHAPDTKEGSR